MLKVKKMNFTSGVRYARILPGNYHSLGYICLCRNAVYTLRSGTQ